MADTILKVDNINVYYGNIHAGNGFQGGGLTGTVGADQTGDLVAADHQVEAVHGGQAAEVDAQFPHVQNGLFVLIAVGQEAAGGHTV